VKRTREAIILAGGFGTRLAHVVPDVCKPMAPVADRPFLRYVLDQLDAAGFGHVVIADGYRREQIESYFMGTYRGLQIDYSPEDEPLLTGGAVKKALKLCSNNYVFVLNGDTWFDVDFAAIEAAAKERKPIAVVAAKRMHHFDRYGTLDIDTCGAIRAFREKMPCEEGLINGGVYLIQRNALDSMPEKFSLETGFFERAVSKSGLIAVECHGDFIDIGIPKDYEYAQEMFRNKHGNVTKLAMFDRDGTINVDVGHLHEPDKIELIDSTVEKMRYYANDSAWNVAVVSNQAGVAKGLYGINEMRATNEAMEQMLEDRFVRVDAWYYCPHHPEFTGDCDCRKPAPGMLLRAMRDFDACPDNCVMYGDKDTDRKAAEAAGVKFFWAGMGLEEAGDIADE
jgi:D-glycero-alpha-D-manno-heptose 1-phosphate guanylyltransferase